MAYSTRVCAKRCLFRVRVNNLNWSALCVIWLLSCCRWCLWTVYPLMELAVFCCIFNVRDYKTNQKYRMLHCLNIHQFSLHIFKSVVRACVSKIILVFIIIAQLLLTRTFHSRLTMTVQSNITLQIFLVEKIQVIVLHDSFRNKKQNNPM